MEVTILKDEFTNNDFFYEQIEDDNFCIELLSPEERLDTIASILAIAAMRFKQRKSAENNKRNRRIRT